MDSSVAAADASLADGKMIVATTTTLPGETATDTDIADGKCVRMSVMKSAVSNISIVPAIVNVAIVVGT